MMQGAIATAMLCVLRQRRKGCASTKALFGTTATLVEIFYDGFTEVFLMLQFDFDGLYINIYLYALELLVAGFCFLFFQRKNILSRVFEKCWSTKKTGTWLHASICVHV